MKKYLSIIIALTLFLCSIVSLVGCSKVNSSSFDIVYITDGGAINDKAQNQSAWNGVKEYCDTNNMTCRYYQPSIDEKGNITTETIDKYIKLSADNGTKYIVLQGDKTAVIINELAKNYSDINFLLVDAFPHDEDSTSANVIDNVMTISFDTEQAGFLAGYTSVALNYTKLGFFGSESDANSQSYGTGFVNGASYAADEKGIPVVMEYANYDSSNLDYDYSFTVKPVYQKIEDAKEQTYKVTVVDGQGSGVYTDGENVTIKANPSTNGKVFDHWEVKSDTDGVKDSKVNISSEKESTMNLLVGDCDCIITAIFKDATTIPVNIIGLSNTVEETVYTEADNTVWVDAPVATSGMVFDHWETDDLSIIDNPKSKGINVKVSSDAITLKAIYVKSDTPTFNVDVVNGTGSGSYVAGDKIEIVAEQPEDGYMFYKWDNVDNQGLSTGIAMENEYCYNTSFEMVDRYSSIPEAMYDEGTQVIFGGGNSQSTSIFTATNSISHQVYAFGWRTDQNDLGNCLASVVTDYRVAIINALGEYKGGTNYLGDCSNSCLYVTNISIEPTYTDDKGNEVNDEKYNEGYSNIFKALADGSLKLNGTISESKCLTVNYWVK